MGGEIMSDDPAKRQCEQCGHLWDDHLLFTEDPLVGGWMQCPVEGCDCHHTWSVKSARNPTYN